MEILLPFSLSCKARVIHSDSPKKHLSAVLRDGFFLWGIVEWVYETQAHRLRRSRQCFWRVFSELSSWQDELVLDYVVV